MNHDERNALELIANDSGKDAEARNAAAAALAAADAPPAAVPAAPSRSWYPAA